MPSVQPISSRDAAEPVTVCAVVVAYFPDPEFDLRLQVVRPQVGLLVVIDNTPEESRLRRIGDPYRDDARILVIENRTNVGVAAALNQGLAIALERRYAWMLTLDQDTRPYPDMVRTLMCGAEVCGVAAAVIGGNYFDTRRRKLKVAATGDSDFLEQKTVITSGCLVNTNMAQRIGGFREDYFIDQVDHEFCLRARAHGYGVYISRTPVMEHSIGNAEGAAVTVFGLAPPDHAPFRKYYIARNSVVSMMDYWRREPMWCVRRMGALMLKLVSIVLLQKEKMPKLRAFFSGIADGVHRRMGPCTTEKSRRFR